MDTRTGEIITAEEAKRLQARFGMDRAILMKIAPTPRQLERQKVGRNEPCPCGSGKKFKRCHLLKGENATP